MLHQNINASPVALAPTIKPFENDIVIGEAEAMTILA